MSGAIDLWASRRTAFERCEWYQRDEKATKDLSKIVYKEKPSAIFHAKEANSITYQKQEFGGAFLGDETSVTIQTHDVLDGIKAGDRIRYKGVLWGVTSVQKAEEHKQAQLMEAITKSTYIGLRR